MRTSIQKSDANTPAGAIGLPWIAKLCPETNRKLAGVVFVAIIPGPKFI